MQPQHPIPAPLLSHEQYLRTILTKYDICVACLLRIFNIMTPKLYSDHQISMGVLRELQQQAEVRCQGEVSEGYRFMVGESGMCLKEEAQTVCWLCSGVLQGEFIEGAGREIIEKVKAEHYGHKQKYKLNVKIHNLINMKFQIFCNLALAQLQKLQLITPATRARIHKQVITPLFDKTGLDMKTVLKWKLSHCMNQQPAEVFTLCSTINEDQQTVIVGLEIDHSSEQLEQAMTNMLGPSLHLDKLKLKKQKMGRIEMGEGDTYGATWTAGLINRIGEIGFEGWDRIAEAWSVDTIRRIEQGSEKKITMKIALESENLLFCGKYVKFSRYLSQTPWIINRERLTESSLQQQVQKKILRLFYPQDIPEDKISIKFHAGGREDVDVRMLKGGRPFVVEFVNPRRTLSDVSVGDILARIRKEYPSESQKLPKESQITEQSAQIKCRLLQFYINVSTQLAKVNSFAKTDPSYISKQLKQAQIQKIKHYVCFIKSTVPFTHADKHTLESLSNLAVLQKTPVRVLHRRTLMYRDKLILKMLFHPASPCSAVLEIWASAGTYIKEFVHGDLGRTMPNVGSILGKEVDILQLDVGSLKEGEWQQGDHEVMRLGQLPWESMP